MNAAPGGELRAAGGLWGPPARALREMLGRRFPKRHRPTWLSPGADQENSVLIRLLVAGWLCFRVAAPRLSQATTWGPSPANLVVAKRPKGLTGTPHTCPHEQPPSATTDRKADNGLKSDSGAAHRVQAQPAELPTTSLQALKQRAHQLLESQRSLQQQNQALAAERLGFERERDQQATQHQELSAERDALQAERDSLTAHLQELTAQRDSIQQQWETLQKTVEELQGQLTAQSAQTLDQSQKREALRTRVEELQGQLSAQSAQALEQSQERESLQTRVEELQHQVSARTEEQRLHREQVSRMFEDLINRLLTLIGDSTDESGIAFVSSLDEAKAMVKDVCHRSDVNAIEACMNSVVDELQQVMCPLVKLSAIQPVCADSRLSFENGFIAFDRPDFVSDLIHSNALASTHKASVFAFGSRKSRLRSLFDIYGSDKDSNDPLNNLHNPFAWPPHAYGLVYEMIFAPIRKTARLVFECGIGTSIPGLPSSMGATGRQGASLRAWRDFFTNAWIHGADIDRSCLFSEERITTHFVDQTDPFIIRKMWDSIDCADFDVIIDDGLHQFTAGSCFFKESFGKLRSGGMYVIEDVAICDWQRYMAFFDDAAFSGSIIALQCHEKRDYFDNALIVIAKD